MNYFFKESKNGARLARVGVARFFNRKILVTDSRPDLVFYLAWWRSGNASVCKTDMRGFDSRPRLKRVTSKLLCLCPGIERIFRTSFARWKITWLSNSRFPPTPQAGNKQTSLLVSGNRKNFPYELCEVENYPAK